ncbi:putative disease resistance protein RGA3 [Prunus yedoensis var. nudiflora]|uniref:Putative disease resistance protein RGA3 n=1 Tax=Prunus yedoensis var. nudiflora TaxID=2094558 RepID=A0A314Y2Z0_PRUYE|nr:putative disease resistance protein RGA3 [Prunus yedoensis var. nudiflora]
MKKATTTTKVANCFSLMSDVHQYRIKHRMKDLQARFDEILKGGTALHLLATVSQTTDRIPGLNVNVQTSSYNSEISAVYGRDVDKEKIQDMLLWEHQQQQEMVLACIT